MSEERNLFDGHSLCFGAVSIMEGRYKGEIGYYDDDICTKNGEKAIVYLGESFGSKCIILSHSHLENVSVPQHEEYLQKNPSICSLLGIY